MEDGNLQLTLRRKALLILAFTVMAQTVKAWPNDP